MRVEPLLNQTRVCQNAPIYRFTPVTDSCNRGKFLKKGVLTQPRFSLFLLRIVSFILATIHPFYHLPVEAHFCTLHEKYLLT
ncbi:hypothetical protein E5353_01380 [Bacteroides caecimuris]|uniref:Uncharacterized protein n=1 Tax=Bacteroides caecimuris TaxID=1796613 RepID=A0A4S2DFP8_9BACE|nr:hypothetical protein E5353_01380 [Bacteroides caecimuris]